MKRIIFASLLVLNVLALFALASASVSAAVIFSDDFADGNLDGWTITNSAGLPGTPWASTTTTQYAEAKPGFNSVDGTTILERVISTAGFQTIVVKYNRQLGEVSGTGLELSDEFNVSWSVDGVNYNLLEETGANAYASDPNFVSKSFDLGTSANNNATFRVKFTCLTDAQNEFCRADNIAIEGTAISQSTLTISQVQPMNFKQNATLTLTNTGQTALSNLFLEATSVNNIILASFLPSNLISSIAANSVYPTTGVITLYPTSVSNLRFGDNILTVNARQGSVSGQVLGTSNFIFRKTFCSSGQQGANLTITEVSMDNEGNGDDESWTLLDTIEVKVDVDNNNNDISMKSVYVDIGLFDNLGNDKIRNMDFEDSDEDRKSLGSIKDGDSETATFRFKVPADFNIDNYRLTAKAYSKSSGVGESKECADDANGQSVTVERESDDDKMIVIDKIVFPSELVCNELGSGSFTAYNIGDGDQEQVRVTIRNAALGLNQEVDIRNGIKEDDSQDASFTFTIPSTAKNGDYPIEFKAFYDDGQSGPFFSSDSSLKLIGCTGSSAAGVSITYTLDSDPIAGSELTVSAVIKNEGSQTQSFSFDALGYQSWASSVDISPASATLDAGESKTITITLNAKDDASGIQSFTLQSESDGDVETQEVEVEFAEKQSGFSLFSGSNGIFWVIGIINLVLIVLIIVVAVRLASRK